MIAYTCDTARPGEGGGAPPLLDGDHSRGGGAERAAGPAVAWRLGYRRGTDLEVGPAPLPGLDRHLPRGERAALRGARGALAARYQRVTGGDHRGVGGRDAYRFPSSRRSCKQPGPRRAGAGLPRHGHRAVRRCQAGRSPALFDEMYERRQRVARQADFADFQAFSFAAKCRFDYTPDDCTRFHDAVEADGRPGDTRACWPRGGSGSASTRSGPGIST